MLEKIEILKNMIVEIKGCLQDCNTYKELDEKLIKIFDHYESAYDLYAMADWDFTNEFASCEIEAKFKENKDCGVFSIRLEEPKA